MEQPLLKLCIVSPSWRFRVVRWRRRRLATVEPTKGFVETRPFESVVRNRKPSRSLIFMRLASLTYVERFTTGQTILSWGHFLTAKMLESFPRSVFPNLW